MSEPEDIEDGFVLEYSPRHGPRRRVEYRPAAKCPHWWRTEQEYVARAGVWRTVGEEAVSQPEVADNRALARAEAGP